jgi:hypothetical protein
MDPRRPSTPWSLFGHRVWNRVQIARPRFPATAAMCNLARGVVSPLRPAVNASRFAGTAKPPVRANPRPLSGASAG